MSEVNRILLLVLLSLIVKNVYGDKNQPVVTYDGRSIIINGSRELLFSGSIHYPRSTPDVRIFFSFLNTKFEDVLFNCY